MSNSRTMLVSPSFGSFVFDCVFHADHTLNIIPTEHPVDSEAPVTDHAYIDPREVSIEIGMTDSAMSTGAVGRSVNAYQVLEAIAVSREPVKLITRLRTYNNMLIVSLSAPDDITTMNSLKASIIFREIVRVSVSTVSVQSTTSASKTTTTATTETKKKTTKKKTTKKKTTKKKAPATKKPNQSILKQAATKKSGIVGTVKK